MKTRDGFVTNSSSSSFIVVMKNDVSEDEIKAKIETLFGLDEGHLLYSFAKDVIQTFLYELGKSTEYDNLKELLDDFYIDENDDFAKLFIEYGNLRYGYFSDDSGDDTQTWLCNNGLNYEDDDIIIQHEGGY